MERNTVKSKQPKFTVRRYQETDKERCRDLWRELVEWHREIYANPTIGGARPEDYFDRHLTRVGSGKIWVVEHNATVVGFAGLVLEDGDFIMDPIVVASEFRGKGVGKQLVKTLIQEAQKLGASQLHVEPVARNAEAIKFYHEMGFVNVGKVQLFIDFSGKKWSRGFKMHNRKFCY